MNTDRQRDADLDRMLRATLGPGDAGGDGACPDAGLMASFVEGGVSAQERTALETHFASCHRCQDALAILARDGQAEFPEQRAAAPSRSWLWRGHLHWLIPVTAASALVVYIASKPAIAPNVVPTPPPDSTQVAALPRQAPEPATVLQTPTGAAAEKREARAAPAPADELPRGGAAMPAARQPGESSQPQRMAAAAPVPAAPMPKSEKAKPAQAEAEAADRVAGNVAPRADLDAKRAKPAAEPAAVAAPPPVFAPVVAPQAAPPAPPAAPSATPQPPAGAAAGAAPGAAATETGAARIAAAEAAREAPAQKSVLDQMSLIAPPSVVEVAAPGGSVAWRVGPAGAIWRSADEGRTWYPQKSGVTAALLAAAAPSATTCWAVGAAGTVLLTDDGERWERRRFPEAVDLVAVEARSSHVATVRTRDGRRFTTSNRGTTWVRK